MTTMTMKGKTIIQKSTITMKKTTASPSTNYVWQGFGALGVNPVMAGEYIHTILKGKLGRHPTKQDVFKDAERKTSPLHKATGCGFDWNKNSAYEKHNIAAACRLLEGLQVQYVEVIGTKRIIKNKPATVIVTRDKKGIVQPFGNRFGRDKRNGWNSTIEIFDEAMKTPDVRAAKIQEAIVVLESWEERYKMLSKSAGGLIVKAKAELKKEMTKKVSVKKK